MSVAVPPVRPWVGVILAGALLLHLLMLSGQAAMPSLTDLTGVAGHDSAAHAAAGDPHGGDETPAPKHDAHNMLAFCLAIVVAASTAVLAVAWRRAGSCCRLGGRWAVGAGRGTARVSPDPPLGPPSRVAAGVLLRV